MLTSFAASTACANRYHPGPRRPVIRVSARRVHAWISLLLCILAVAAQSAATADTFADAACLASHYDDKATIRQVIDGDTVILDDDRHIRLIGINTPETGHHDRPAQPGADEAYNYLNNLLHTQKTVRLYYDQERTDRYGRTLAHVFLQDGTNIQSLLLTRGLATTLTIPPNLAFLECYETSAVHAQNRGIGLWALGQYQPLPAAAISRGSNGFRIITGSVVRIGKSKSNTWINLEHKLSLRIARQDLNYFGDLEQLIGNRVMARGRLYYSNGEFRMQIRHPVDLKIIDMPAQN